MQNSYKKEVYNRLYEQIYEHCPDPVTVGMFMVNSGPGTETYIPQGKVHLLEGWTKPAAPEEEENTHAA
jgi:hypothetical protein